MKKFLSIFLSILFILSLTACKNTSDSTPDEVSTQNFDATIYGTWICEDISNDCYFKFDENGDCSAIIGSCTIYGIFAVSQNNGSTTAEIELSGFFYDVYTLTFYNNNTTVMLSGYENSYTLTRATLPDFSLPPNDNAAIINGLVGNWASDGALEYFQFNSDGTAMVTDILNEAITLCNYTCNSNVITLTYVQAVDKTATREIIVEFIDDNHITLDSIPYERATS